MMELITALCDRYGVKLSTAYAAVYNNRLPAARIRGKRYTDEKIFTEWNGSRRGTVFKKVRRNNRQCEQCVYGIKFDGSWACNYLEIVGSRRDCDTYPSCEKFLKKGKKRKKCERRI